MYARRALAALGGLVLVTAVGCGGNDPVELGEKTGKLEVTAQALTEGMVDEVRVKIVPVDDGSGLFGGALDPSDMIGDTYVLGYNGKEWTSTFRGIKTGCYDITAKAFKDGELVFETNKTVRACVPAGSTATANLVILHQVGHVGLQVPAIRWITTDATTVRPGEIVKIRVGFDYEGDKTVHLSFYDDKDGTPAPGYIENPPNSLSIGWKAPSTRDTLIEPHDPIVLQLTDGTPSPAFNIRFNVFIRVLWDETDPLDARFRLNLAPEITNITVSPSNPAAGVIGNILTGHVKLGFTAVDPDPCDPEVEPDTCKAPTFAWTIPTGCGFVMAPGGTGSFPAGTATLSRERTLDYPMFENVNPCVLTLTITDSQGAVTTTSVTVVPFEESTLYTPTIAIDFRFGDEARPGYGLLFGVLANYRLDYIPGWDENADWWVDVPKVFWRLAGGTWEVDAGTEVVSDDTVADTEFLQRYVATRSQYEWLVGDRSGQNDDGFCETDTATGARWVKVTAMACHPMLDSPGDVIDILPPGFVGQLCDELVFQVQVPAEGDNVVQVCGSQL